MKLLRGKDGSVCAVGGKLAAQEEQSAELTNLATSIKLLKLF